MSYDIRVGDKVERIADGRSKFPKGATGTVIDVRDGNVDVKTSGGYVSTGNAPHKLRVLTNRAPATDAPCGNTSKPTKPMLNRLNKFMKRFLDSKSQTLYKAGFINGDLLPTREGLDALNAILFQLHIDALVESAQEVIDEAEKEDAE